MTPQYVTLDIPDDPTPWTIVEPTKDKEWCVLWLQGWSSSIEGHYEGIYRMAQASNISFAMLDYAGHGKHPIEIGKSTHQQQLTEVIAVYDELRKRGYKKVIAIGGSFGSYMAALLCGQRELQGLVLRAPAIYREEWLSLTHDETQEDREPHDKTFRNSVSATSKLSALGAVRAFDKSVYVLEHELDEIIPKNIPKAYFEVAKRGNYLVVPATTHAPKLMPEPQKHFAYIESVLISILKLTQLEITLPIQRD